MTLTVPTICGWIAQMYLNVPARLNVRPNDAPGATVPEFQAPPVAVVVCETRSAFLHTILVPLVTVITRGEKT